jgi:hypothetical protein
VNFGKIFGFSFFAHAIGHSNRKGRIERPFYFIENNFLAGREFENWEDINQQSIDWCTTYANQKIKRVLGKNPETVFIQEKPFLQPLPDTLPPVYEHCQRTVDTQGYINLEANRYSVPERLVDKNVDVYKYPKEVRIVYQHQEIAVHQRITDRSNARQKCEGHHTRNRRQFTQYKADQTELELTGQNEILSTYFVEFKKRVRSHRQLDRLLQLKRTYPSEAFISAVTRAYAYGLYDLARLEELILKHIAGDFFNLPTDEE